MYIYVYMYMYIYICICICLFKEKNETFHFVKYFGIAFINYIFIYYTFIEQNTYKIHYIQSFLKLQF